MADSDKSKVTLYLPPGIDRRLRIQSAINTEEMSAIVEKAIDFYLKYPEKIEEMRAVALAALLGRLLSKDVKVRLGAVISLSHLGDEKAIPALCNLLETDQSPEIRRSAAEALGMIEDKRINALSSDTIHIVLEDKKAIKTNTYSPDRETSEALMTMKVQGATV